MANETEGQEAVDPGEDDASKEAEGSENQTDGSSETGETGEKAEFKLQDVKREYFAPDNLEAAQEKIGNVLSVCPDGFFKSNFDLETEVVPDGFGVAIVPISQRQQVGDEQKTVVLGATIAAVPSPQIILGDENGKKFVEGVLIDTCIAKVANSVRPKDGVLEDEVYIPKTLEHFITVAKKGEGLKTFNELAPRVIKALKKKTKGGMKFLTPQILRQVLQNSSWAKHTFPKVPDEGWNVLLDTMIKTAENEKKDTNILLLWKNTRDEAEMVEVAEDDFDLAIASLE